MKLHDPRDVITPDAFSVAPELLGLRLAGPWRRLAAFSTDLLLVAIFSQSGVVVLLALVTAVLLWRALSPGTSQSLTRRAGRTALRIAAAVFVFLLVVNLWKGARSLLGGFGDDADDEEEEVADLGSMASDLATIVALERDTSATAPQDSLALLAARYRILEQENRQLRRRAERDEDRGPVRAFFAETADELGLGLGWIGFYFTVLTVLGRGQTPGKRLLGVRVIRLDARPLGWWYSFERFGGYAASLFSGMVGFAQIFWDRNRQALHDKATETVVIRVVQGQPVRVARLG